MSTSQMSPSYVREVYSLSWIMCYRYTSRAKSMYYARNH